MRKGVSPIIATVILIALSVTLGFIIYNSGNDFIAQLSTGPYCTDVMFYAGIYKASDSSYSLEVDNKGNIPIIGFELRISDQSRGQIDSQVIKVEVEAAQSISKEVILDEDPYEKEIILIPIIKNAEGYPLPCDASFGKIIQQLPGR